MTGFVYRWTNIINYKWYIGSHKGTTDDGYRHSSKIHAAAENKYGQENFTREILFEGDYEKDKIRSVKETEYLRKENAANNPMSYNRTNITGPDCFSKEYREKLGTWQRNKPKSKEHRKNISKSLKGRSVNPETQFKKGCTPWNKGKLLNMEHIKNLSVSHEGKRYQIATCPHCRKSGGLNAMNRWHFDNCKKIINTTQT